MPYLPDLNTYLHHSSLLLSAYPTTRITTKYSLPRKPNPHTKSTTPSKRSQKAHLSTTSTTDAPATSSDQPLTPITVSGREKKEPSATLILKTYHPESGICLKYKTEKSQEVGRLIAGLGRLAAGETLDLPASGVVGGGGDGMEIDGVGEEKTAAEVKETGTQQTQGQPQAQQAGGGSGGGGGGKKKKKGKK